MNKYINLTIGLLIWFVPAIILRHYIGIEAMGMWLSFSWVASLASILYLD